MIAEIGHYALVLAFILAIVQSTVPLWGAARGDRRLTAVAVPAALLQLLLIGTAFLALMQAYVTSDFSLVNVATNSHSAKPLLYKISGVWANHQGSMVLWVMILALFGAAVAGLGSNLPETLRARVLAVQGMIGTGFLAFILFTSNPFLRIDPAPLDGAGLHPPMLYLGYVGFSMAFSFAIAGLIEGRVEPAWARWVRPWTLAAWSFLTLGIALGSWWAYYELGWGGWWFWDPVENASFMPWLAGTALLHSAVVFEKRGALKAWTILLAILAFSLSLIGTFLVRSGVLTSVHAFATDPERGLFILVLLAITIGGSLTLFALRAPRLKEGGVFAPISREGALVLNNLLLTTATLTVFVGTLYPLLLDALGGGKISVGPPYFEATFVPLMIPTLIAVAIGPMMAWKRGDARAALARLRLAMAVVVITVLGTLALADSSTALAALGTGLAAWLIAGSAVEWADRVRLFRMPLAASFARARHLPRAAWGMTLAHAGLGLLVAGITGSSAWQTERIQVMRPGDMVELAGYEVTLVGVGEVNGPNYTAERALFRVESDGRQITLLEPEKRFYPVEGSQTTEAAIHTTLIADLYAVIGDPDGQGGWTTRIYHNPLVPWIWAGCLVMVAGGILSLTDRRHRVGAPARPHPARAAQAPA
jgi:cytochrome c-type biogenesis protein CcmF